MVCNPFSLRFRSSFFSLYNSPLSPRSLPNTLLRSSLRSPPLNSTIHSSIATVSASKFTWDDVFEIARSRNDASDLRRFFDKIKIRNRRSLREREFGMEMEGLGFGRGRALKLKDWVLRVEVHSAGHGSDDGMSGGAVWCGWLERRAGGVGSGVVVLSGKRGRRLWFGGLS